MSDKKNVIYLYSEVMPYAIAVMRELVKSFGISVHCVYWDENKKTPFYPENEHGITFYKRSGYDAIKLINFIADKQPQFIYVSGRMDKLYLQMALHFRKTGVRTITGFDSQWHNSRKQQLQAALGKVLYRNYFDYIWVPGNRQYVFARQMGYADNKIIRNCYTADTNPFMAAYENNKKAKKAHYPHTIVFAGRFTEVKGIDTLTSAFAAARQKTNADWKLVLVGSGNLKFKSTECVEVIDFIPNEELAARSKNWGVFCLPSRKEAWGVVVHEFAAAGLPLLCSDAVGASDAFVISGYNGYTFRMGDVTDLERKLIMVMNMSDEDIFAMGEKSHLISKVIDPQKAAYSLMSILL